MANIVTIQTASRVIRLLHFMMNDSECIDITADCQKMIDVLFDKFPTAAAKHS